MKSNRYLVPLGLIVFLLLCFVPNGSAQTGQQVSYATAPAQLALSWTFTASSPSTSAFTVYGLRYFQLYFVPTGTVSSCAISLDSSAGSGFSTGGILSSSTIGSCASATVFASSSTTPTLLGQLTPTISGSGAVTVILLGYVNNPGAAGSSSAAITSPVDGSGYVEVNCKTGCAGGNANGQATMANSAPVAIASNQSAVPVSGTFWQTTQPVSGSFWQTTQPVSIASMPSTPVTGTVTTTGATTPADATANPSTAGLNFSLSALYNGSTWDRLRSAGIGNTVAATGIAAASPYCEFLTSLPTLTNATYAAAQCDSSGRLFVDISNSTLAVTESGSPWTMNVTQFGGSNVATGTGASGAGIPRVTLSNDSSLAANQSVNINQVGGTTVVLDPCQANAGSASVINLTASGQVIAGTASKQTYICSLDIVTATAQNLALVEGTGTTCATSIAGMAGGSTAATGWNFGANAGLVKGNGAAWVYKTATTADNVCILLSSTGQTSGSIRYVQQ